MKIPRRSPESNGSEGGDQAKPFGMQKTQTTQKKSGVPMRLKNHPTPFVLSKSACPNCTPAQGSTPGVSVASLGTEDTVFFASHPLLLPSFGPVGAFSVSKASQGGAFGKRNASKSPSHWDSNKQRPVFFINGAHTVLHVSLRFVQWRSLLPRNIPLCWIFIFPTRCSHIANPPREGDQEIGPHAESKHPSSPF